VDVSNLGAHEVLHVSDIRVDEGVTILTDPETAVATVAVVREEPVEEIAAAEEVTEPEVIGKGKKEDEE
jgi:large subunit ribosomal protein L25